MAADGYSRMVPLRPYATIEGKALFESVQVICKLLRRINQRGKFPLDATREWVVVVSLFPFIVQNFCKAVQLLASKIRITFKLFPHLSMGTFALNYREAVFDKPLLRKMVSVIIRPADGRAKTSVFRVSLGKLISEGEVLQPVERHSHQPVREGKRPSCGRGIFQPPLIAELIEQIECFHSVTIPQGIDVQVLPAELV